MADALECLQYGPPRARRRSAYPGVRHRRPGPRNLQGLLLSRSMSAASLGRLKKQRSMVGAPAFMRGRSALALRERVLTLVTRFSAGSFLPHRKQTLGAPFALISCGGLWR